MKGRGADEPYWEALSRNELQLPRCKSCGHWHWPAPFRCQDCGGWDFEWVTTPMEGTLYTWTRTWHPFAGTEQLGSPYVSVLVELPQAGGIRLLGLFPENRTPEIGERVMGKIGVSHAFDHDVPVIHWAGAHS